MVWLQPLRLKMRKRLVLLQALAILMAMFQYGMKAAEWDEGRNSNRILSNPYLTVRYAKNPLEFYHDVPISTTAWSLFKLTPVVSCQVKSSVYTLHSSLQDTSCRFWCWWVAGNNWSNESCLCTSTEVSENASVDGAPANTHWDPLYLWKGELIRFWLGTTQRLHCTTVHTSLTLDITSFSVSYVLSFKLHARFHT